MTRPDGPVPPSSNLGPSGSGDAEYVRKLALAILSALQNKGLLSADEVDAILIAARRAAQTSGAQSPAAQAAQTPATPPRPDPAPRGPLQFQVTAKPAAPPPSVEWSVRKPPPASEKEAERAPAAQAAATVPEAPAPTKEPGATSEGSRPPVIDIDLG